MAALTHHESGRNRVVPSPPDRDRRLAKGERFIVAGGYGPLREGELERAREWGADLAQAMATKQVAVPA